jgi:hypothetical protein
MTAGAANPICNEYLVIHKTSEYNEYIRVYEYTMCALTYLSRWGLLQAIGTS